MTENIIRVYARTPMPCQILGFLWPKEPIIFPESWLTPVHRKEMVESNRIAVEISKDGGETWENLDGESRDAGCPPTSVPAPSSEALVGARAKGIYYTPPTEQAKEEPAFDVLGVPIRRPAPVTPIVAKVEPEEQIDPLEGICLDCGQFLKNEVKEAGHKTHTEAGIKCRPPRKAAKGAQKTTAQFLAGGVDKD